MRYGRNRPDNKRAHFVSNGTEANQDFYGTRPATRKASSWLPGFSESMRAAVETGGMEVVELSV
jgi:hypothetical protein